MHGAPLYQDCFSTADMRHIWSQDTTLEHWLLIEHCLAQCQSDLGLIPSDAAQAIAQVGMDDIDQDALARSMLLVGRPIVGLVEQMRAALPSHSAHVHYKSTTQDIMDTALCVQMKAALALVQNAIDGITARLDSHIAGHPDTQILGRTNGQHAQPIRLRTKLEVWKAELCRRQETLHQAARRGLNVQVGGPTGDLSAYDPETGPALKAMMAQRLGLNCVEPHWQNARDGIADIIGALGTLCASLEKIHTNINTLSSSDIAELSETYTEGAGASSALAHKRNQRASEFGQAVAHLGCRRASDIAFSMQHMHERSGGAWIAEWALVPDTFLLTSGALHWTDSVMERLEFDPMAMQSRIDGFGNSI